MATASYNFFRLECESPVKLKEKIIEYEQQEKENQAARANQIQEKMALLSTIFGAACNGEITKNDCKALHVLSNNKQTTHAQLMDAFNQIKAKKALQDHLMSPHPSLLNTHLFQGSDLTLNSNLNDPTDNNPLTELKK